MKFDFSLMTEKFLEFLISVLVVGLVVGFNISKSFRISRYDKIIIQIFMVFEFDLLDVIWFAFKPKKISPSYDLESERDEKCSIGIKVSIKVWRLRHHQGHVIWISW